MIDLVLTCSPAWGRSWAVAAQLGLRELGIELDAAACATRRAAGHLTVRADVARFPVKQLAGKTCGQTHSPPCTTFSAAGDQAGNALLEMLAALTRDMFAGRDTRAECRREMTAELTRSEWAADLERGTEGSEDHQGCHVGRSRRRARPVHPRRAA